MKKRWWLLFGVAMITIGLSLVLLSPTRAGMEYAVVSALFFGVGLTMVYFAQEIEDDSEMSELKESQKKDPQIDINSMKDDSGQIDSDEDKAA